MAERSQAGGGLHCGCAQPQQGAQELAAAAGPAQGAHQQRSGWTLPPAPALRAAARRGPLKALPGPRAAQGESAPRVKNIFTLNTCASIVGADVISYDDESTLLESWAEFVRKADPDIITGYNINNFDLPYLINRSAKAFFTF